jgi:hypothetical protein
VFQAAPFDHLFEILDEVVQRHEVRELRVPIVVSAVNRSVGQAAARARAA